LNILNSVSNLDQGACFASNTTLRLVTGHSKRMSDLLVGDLVFVKRENDVIVSAVLAIFRHHRHSISYIDIHTEGSTSPLRLTPLHSLLILRKHGKNECYSFAQDVSVGDYVFTSNLRRVKVIDVKELFIHDDYAYAPLTFEGTIIVNDIIASCYGTYSHSTMHMLTTPIRWWYLIVFQFRRVMELDRLQKLTSNLIVYFIDFYLK
jgi:hedgehog protein